ncbi:translation machinery-associated protein 16 [Lecanora helva]
MPKLSKVQKKLTKKHGKSAVTLHENSRDAQKLRRQGARSERLEKLAVARAKGHQPLLQRIAFFQGVAKAAEGAIGPGKIHELVQSYLGRHDEELAELESQRRPGRPSSTREDLLRQAMHAEHREYNSGFWAPDTRDESNLIMLRDWNGEWTALNTFKYIRISRDGELRQSSFPPKALS